jgi:uncharacterized membrane protein (UPF0127 family)
VSSKRFVVGALVLLSLIGLGLWYYITIFRTGESTASTAKLVLAAGPQGTYTLETASDQAGQTKGLSGRTELGSQSGMLFRYGETAERCMWMKDMRINLDMIWLDADQRIVSIVQNVTPASYPHTYCATAKDVIELPAGAVRTNGVRVGQVVKL